MWMSHSDWWIGAVADVIPEVSQPDRRSILEASGDKLSLNIEYEELRLDLFSSGNVFSVAILHHAKPSQKEKRKTVKRTPVLMRHRC